MSNYQAALELNKLNAEVLSKTAFMLITASTASIAYILTQIKNESWSVLIYFPMYSLVLLSLSFIFGCFFLTNQAKLFNANSNYLQNHLTQQSNQMLVLQQMLSKHLDNLTNRSNWISRWQFLLFIFGAIVYSIYVFLQIYLK